MGRLHGAQRESPVPVLRASRTAIYGDHDVKLVIYIYIYIFFFLKAFYYKVKSILFTLNRICFHNK